MNIDDMQAGPEIDRLVAERVMGWSATTDRNAFTSDTGVRTTDNDSDDETRFRPSTDIAHAFEMVAVVREYLTLLQSPTGGDLVEWCAEFADHRAVADTPPLAICRAALKAVGHG